MRPQFPEIEPDVTGLFDVLTPLRSLLLSFCAIATVAACLGILVLAVRAGLLRRDILPGAAADVVVRVCWWAVGLGTLVALVIGGVALSRWGYLVTIACMLGAVIVLSIVFTFVSRRRW